MDIQETLRILDHQPVVGYMGSEERLIFDYYIKKYGIANICLTCSTAYSMGYIQGKRDERSRRKKEKALMPDIKRRIIEQLERINNDEKFLRCIYTILRRHKERG